MADQVTSTLARLEGRKTAVLESKVYSQTIKLLDLLHFLKIRCLALGSPTNEFQALYQLAFLQLLADQFEVKKVSCWDPAFSEEDKLLLQKVGFLVEENETLNPTDTLYYMPHAPRTFTNNFIKERQPRWILGNDLTVTAGSYGKAKFLEELPTLATIVHMTEDAVVQKDDGFSMVKRKKKKNQKYVFKEPELEYPTDLYFDRVDITRIDGDSNQPWKELFSDMALNVFQPKDVETGLENLSIA